MDNNITTVAGSISYFKFLRVLNLSRNNIKDLKSVLYWLGRNPYLKELYLQGNPVAEESNYKMRVLQAIPSLEVLDSHAITDKDRYLRQQASRPKTSKKNESNLNVSVSSSTSEKKTEGKVKNSVSLKQELYWDVNRIMKNRREEEKRRTIALFNAQSKEKEPNKTQCPLPDTLNFIAQQSKRNEGQLSEWDKYSLFQSFKKINSKIADNRETTPSNLKKMDSQAATKSAAPSKPVAIGGKVVMTLNKKYLIEVLKGIMTQSSFVIDFDINYSA